MRSRIPRSPTFEWAAGWSEAAGARTGDAPGPSAPGRLCTRGRPLSRIGGSVLAARLAAMLGLVLLLALGAAPAAAVDWRPFEEERVVQIVTFDEDGDRRDTKIWVVVLDDAGYIRTNDSRWLANIRRDPEVQLRVRGYEYLMRADEVEDPAVKERVEEAFKEKYGLLQRMMSWFRISEPTVLRLSPREGGATS